MAGTGSTEAPSSDTSFAWRVVDTLGGYSPEALAQVTRSSSIFFDYRWFAMLEDLDLSHLIGGPVQLRFVVVKCAKTGRLVAICPLLVCRHPNIYFFYSLDKYFFLHWPVEAARVEPDKERLFQRIAWGTNAYRAMAKCFGANLGGWVLAVSPLSHRGDVAVDPSVTDQGRRAAILRSIVAGLQQVATQESLPLCFFGVEEQRDELRRELLASQFRELFLVYDHVIDLRALGSLDDYLARFRSSGRRLFRREIAASGRSGFRFEHVAELASLAPQLARLYTATYERYGEEHFHHPPSFWAALAGHLGPHAEALVAYRGREIAGFSLLLGKRDLWFYRVGRCYDHQTEDGRLYFNLAFYEPIRRAVEGHWPIDARPERLWLGAGATQAKHRRGGQGHALYSYLWFPRRWDRWLLMPYLDNFAKISLLTQSTASRATTYLHRR